MRASTILVVSITLVSFGCSSAESGADSGPAPDARRAADGAARDSASSRDTGAASDTGPTPDAEPAIDGSPPTDANTPADGSVTLDANFAGDAGMLPDGTTGADAGTALTDSGPAGDAAPLDGGPDAALDAGPPPTCAITAEPAMATTTTAVTVRATSDATTCSWQLDGVDRGAIGCTSGTATAGPGLPTGDHAVTLVATRAGVTTRCSALVRVAATTCTIGIEPRTSASSGTFTVTAASNGTTCRYLLDGVDTGQSGCMGSAQIAASLFGVGDHTITLLVSDGPGGPTRCSADLTVTGTTGGTTCSMAVTPTSGDLSSTFTGAAASNGTVCRFEVDGVDVGSIPCTGSQSRTGATLGVGTHTFSLVVTAGPGGPARCGDSFLVGRPTCDLRVTPERGPRAGVFTFVASSTGTACRLDIDGFDFGTVMCAASGMSPAGVFVPGPHVATLVVDDGPSGATRCSAAFTVDP